MANEIVVIEDRTTDEKVRRFATDVARESVEKWGNTREIATNIKQKLDDSFAGSWCCIVGRNFSSYCSYCSKNFIEIQVGEVYVLMFQSTASK